MGLPTGMGDVVYGHMPYHVFGIPISHPISHQPAHSADYSIVNPRTGNGPEDVQRSRGATNYLLGAHPRVISPIPAQQQDIPGIQSGPLIHKFECESCHKVFDRESRVENCRNGHSQNKPHACLGQCGSFGCAASYRSVELLKRHMSPKSQCPTCGKCFSRQNLARHKACMHSHSSS